MKEEYNVSSSSSSGVGFFGLLTVLFIALKLLGYIDWSWWWILAPIWMPIAVLILILIVGLIIIK